LGSERGRATAGRGVDKSSGLRFAKPALQASAVTDGGRRMFASSHCDSGRRGGGRSNSRARRFGSVEQRCAGTNVHFGYIVRRAGAFWLTAKGATMAQEADAEMVRMNFFGFGFQYYLAGRYAVAAQLLPVAANLLHHAIEMLLKGELTHLDEKQRRAICASAWEC